MKVLLDILFIFVAQAKWQMTCFKSVITDQRGCCRVCTLIAFYFNRHSSVERTLQQTRSFATLVWTKRYVEIENAMYCCVLLLYVMHIDENPGTIKNTITGSAGLFPKAPHQCAKCLPNGPIFLTLFHLLFYIQ